MAIRRRYANNRKLAAVLYKRAQQYRALADYFYKLADAPLVDKEVAQEVANESLNDIIKAELPDEVKEQVGGEVPAKAPVKVPVKTPAEVPAKVPTKTPAKVEGPKLDYLPIIGGAITGAGIGGASMGGLARLFLGDEQKARKWILLSALLGAAAGGIAGAYGLSPFIVGSNLGKLAPASEAPAAGS